MFTISYTGHRPKDLLGYKADYRPVFNQIKEHLKSILDQHPNESFMVITGGAQGVDQMAFWAAYHLKTEYDITNVLAVPFKGQEERWPELTKFGQKEYRIMISKADKIELLSDSHDNAIQKLDERNHWMVDHSDVLICVTPYENILTRPGGTGNCVRYASKVGHPYVICKIQL